MNSLKKASAGLLALCGLLSGISAEAQNLNNAACGRINNGTNGTIRFRNNNGQFQNSAPVAQVNNAGTIDMTGTNNLFTGTLPLGSSPTNRIPGRVLWSSINPNQNVQNRWYVNLNVSGNTKNMRDSIFVGGAYNIANGTGIRTYNGTFFYDGTGNQVVIAEKNANSYNNLELQNSAVGSGKTLSNDTATVNGTFLNNANNLGGFNVQTAGVLNLRGTSNSNAPFGVNGSNSVVNLTNNSANLSLGNNSTFLADNGGRVNISSTNQPAALIVSTGSTFRLGNTATGGLFFLTGTANMNVLGTYVNQLPALTNAFYDCGTTVRYLATANGQTIQATASAEPNRYGKLETVGGNKTTNGDVHVKCGLGVNPGNGPIHQINTGTSTLFVYNGNPTLTPVTYDSALTDCQSGSEVLGNMRVEVPTTIGTTNSLTFNNRFTSVRFSTATNPPANVTINSQPATNPNNYVAGSDVNRKITVSYASPTTGTANWNATIRGGFRPAEASGLTGLASLANLRTFNSPVSINPTMIGSNYQRFTTTGCQFFWLQADDINPNNLTSGGDLLFRGGPGIVFSGRDGRWSNPATWTNGAEPLPFDTVVVRHNVWAGFTRPATNGWDGFTTAEAYPNAMAAQVRITNQGNSTTFPNPSLIFGLDNTAPVNSGLFIIGGANQYLSNTVGTNGILNLEDCDATGTPRNNLGATDFTSYATTTTSAQPKEKGLVIFGVVGNTQPNVRVNTLNNTGWIQNGSSLEIGD